MFDFTQPSNVNPDRLFNKVLSKLTYCDFVTSKLMASGILVDVIAPSDEVVQLVFVMFAVGVVGDFTINGVVVLFRPLVVVTSM